MRRVRRALFPRHRPETRIATCVLLQNLAYHCHTIFQGHFLNMTRSRETRGTCRRSHKPTKLFASWFVCLRIRFAHLLQTKPISRHLKTSETFSPNYRRFILKRESDCAHGNNQNHINIQTGPTVALLRSTVPIG